MKLLYLYRDIPPHEGMPQAGRFQCLPCTEERRNSGDAKPFPYIDDETNGISKRSNRGKEVDMINMINRTEEKTSCVD
jgi:hypothetical protein